MTNQSIIDLTDEYGGGVCSMAWVDADLDAITKTEARALIEAYLAGPPPDPAPADPDGGV